MSRWGFKAKDDAPHHVDAVCAGADDAPRAERDGNWFDSSWELRQGLVVGEVTEADELPPEWRVAPAR